jgi:hypothetical protein
VTTQPSVSVAIKQENGLVVLKFDRDVNYIEIEPQNMLDMAEAMCAAAFEAKDGLKPVGPALKASLIEQHRDRLIPRVTLMLASMREDKLKTDGYIALQIVDQIFSEIFS